MSNNAIGIPRKQYVFAKKESTKGTLVYPANTDLIVPSGYCTINLQPTFTNSKEIVNSRDVLDRFKNSQPPGTWSMPMYARPNSSLGTAPMGGVLYESLMGTETVNSGTSVTYSQALTKPSFSLWVVKDHSVFFGSGATVGNGKVSLQTQGAVEWQMSGQFMDMGWAGTDVLTADVAAAATTCDVYDADKYTVDAKINIGSDNNSGSGYTITAVNTSSNVVTFTPGAVTGASSGDYVTPWYPTGGSASGSPIENCGSYASIGGSSVPVQSFDISIQDDPHYLEEEITSACAPTDYVETQRAITGTMGIFFRENDLKYFNDGMNTVEKDVKLVAGDTSGNIMEVDLAHATLDVPQIQDSDNTTALNLNITGLGSSGEDSGTITFK